MAQAKASLGKSELGSDDLVMAKKAPQKARPNRLRDLYGALEDQVRTQLEVRRLAHKNAEARGDAAEEVWLELLADHLPSRYRVGKGIVIDADGKESDFIDIIIYDRHFTPPVFNNLYIPAESVLRGHRGEAGTQPREHHLRRQEGASVRRFSAHRGRIVDARGGSKEPKPPFRIAAGIVTYKSSWDRTVRRRRLKTRSARSPTTSSSISGSRPTRLFRGEVREGREAGGEHVQEDARSVRENEVLDRWRRFEVEYFLNGLRVLF